MPPIKETTNTFESSKEHQESPKTKADKLYKEIMNKYGDLKKFKGYTYFDSNKKNIELVRVQGNRDMLTNAKSYGPEISFQIQYKADKIHKLGGKMETSLYRDGKKFHVRSSKKHYTHVDNINPDNTTRKTESEIGDIRQPKEISAEDALKILEQIKMYEQEDKQINHEKIKKTVASAEEQSVQEENADELLAQIEEDVDNTIA